MPITELTLTSFICNYCRVLIALCQWMDTTNLVITGRASFLYVFMAHKIVSAGRCYFFEYGQRIISPKSSLVITSNTLSNIEVCKSHFGTPYCPCSVLQESGVVRHPRLAELTRKEEIYGNAQKFKTANFWAHWSDSKVLTLPTM